MKYTKVSADVINGIQLNAGIICEEFNPLTGQYQSIIGATTGGITASIVPTTSDFGEDIDNMKKNTFQLKRINSWEAKMSGTFVAATKETIKKLIGTVTEETVTPESGAPATYEPKRLNPNEQYNGSDFDTIWWVGDYTTDNSESTGKYIAIRLDNAVNTAGFSIKTTDRAKGQFSFEFLAHYSLTSDAIPFAVFIVENGE